DGVAAGGQHLRPHPCRLGVAHDEPLAAGRPAALCRPGAPGGYQPAEQGPRRPSARLAPVEGFCHRESSPRMPWLIPPSARTPDEPLPKSSSSRDPSLAPNVRNLSSCPCIPYEPGIMGLLDSRAGTEASPQTPTLRPETPSVPSYERATAG